MLFLIFLLSGCAETTITGTSHIQKGIEPKLKQVTTVFVAQFQSSDEVVAQAVRNVIIEMLLPSGVRIVNNKADADVVIQGTITFSYDFVSGITAQLIIGDEIIAAASEAQQDPKMHHPLPPEVMGREIGKKIRGMFGR